jgi:hypothetical protein
MKHIELKRIERLSRKELKQGILDCFEYGLEANPIDRLAVLQQGEFYSRELDRRHESKQVNALFLKWGEQ